MITLRLKRNKLSTGLTTLDPNLSISIDDQKEAIKNWSSVLAKVVISGPIQPEPKDGLRYIKTGPTPPIRNLLGSYMVSMPGAEICVLAAPNLTLGGDIAGMLAHVDTMRMEMAWACHADIAGKPSAFFMSAPVIAHLMGDIPPALSFKDNWQDWVHKWMERLMRHRYFDASQFSAIQAICPKLSDLLVASICDYPIMNKLKVGDTSAVEELKNLPKRGRPKNPVKKVKIA